MTSTADVNVTVDSKKNYNRQQSVATMYAQGKSTTGLRADELFTSVDKDGTGTIDQAEFASLHAIITKEAADAAKKQMDTQKEADEQRKAKKTIGKIALALLAVVVISVGANAAMTAAVVFLSKESEVSVTGTMTVKGSDEPIKVASTDTSMTGAEMTAAGSDVIVQTAPAVQNIPLVVAPVLSHDQLATVTSLSVTLPAMGDFEHLTSLNELGEDEPAEMTRKYTITGYDWVSISQMHFKTTEGDRIAIANGEASVIFTDGNKLPVCAADATCSSFKVEGIDVEAELKKVYGVDAPAELLDASRRRLSNTGACGPCEEDSYNKCAFAVSTDPETKVFDAAINPNLQKNWKTLRLKEQKNCFVGGYCYFRSGDYFNCIRYAQGCSDPSSTYCQSFNRMVDLGMCPESEEAGESTFCTSLDSFVEVGTCVGIQNEETCSNSYEKSSVHPYTNFPDNTAREERDYAGNPGYQKCAWNEAGKYCGKAMDQSGEYEAMTFCGEFCEMMGSSHNLIDGNYKCNQGRLDDQSDEGLPARLSNSEACKNAMFKIGDGSYQGCDWLGPTLAGNYWSSHFRCQPNFYCSNATISMGQCNPACNCMAKQSTICKPAQIMCCQGTSCNVCAAQEIDVDGNIYALFEI